MQSKNTTTCEAYCSPSNRTQVLIRLQMNQSSTACLSWCLVLVLCLVCHLSTNISKLTVVSAEVYLVACLSQQQVHDLFCFARQFWCNFCCTFPLFVYPGHLALVWHRLRFKVSHGIFYSACYFLPCLATQAARFVCTSKKTFQFLLML